MRRELVWGAMAVALLGAVVLFRPRLGQRSARGVVIPLSPAAFRRPQREATSQPAYDAPSIAGVVVSERRPWSAEVVEAHAYGMPNAQGVFAWPDGAGRFGEDPAAGGTSSGVGLMAVPRLAKGLGPEEVDSHASVVNLAHRPGFTDFIVYVSDEDGLVDYVCQKLNEDQLEYVDLRTWGYLSPGFIGSSMVSATFWEHDVFDEASGDWVRNGLGLAVVVDEWATAPTGHDRAVARVAPPLYVHTGIEAGPEPDPTCGSRGPRRPGPPIPTATAGPSPTPTPSPSPTQLPSPTATLSPAMAPPYAPGSPQIHLPSLRPGPQGECAPTISIQNVGLRPAKAVVLVWTTAGGCGPDCAGPAAALCTPIIAPGSAWQVTADALPPGASSAVIYSFDPPALRGLAPCADDPACSCEYEMVFPDVVGECGGYAAFHRAYREMGQLGGVALRDVIGPPLVAEVLRQCADGEDLASGAYAGVAGPALGAPSADSGLYEYALPLLWGPAAGVHSAVAPEPPGGEDGAGGGSVVRIQNAGVECATVELWFEAKDGCEPALCATFSMAPGEAVSTNLATCAAPGVQGAGFVKSSAPAAVTVDVLAAAAMGTYVGAPLVMQAPNGSSLLGAGNSVLFAPLVYARYSGWSSMLRIQNTSTGEAQVLVTFLDRGGNVAATRQLGPLCPGGALTIDAGAVADLPWCWVGSARVESRAADAPPGATPWRGPEPSPTPPDLGGRCAVATAGPSATATQLDIPTPYPTPTVAAPTFRAFIPWAPVEK